jgi:hypothetical protein
MSVVPFGQHLHTIRLKWAELSASEQEESSKMINNLPIDAIPKMKMVARKRIRKGSEDEKFYEEFFGILDDWLSEIRCKESGIEMYKKVAIVTYAVNIAV